ncbi:M48 family peptidase [Thermococcus sp. MV5]|uniref:YgjP-like metallopeptidase domain-containing protein n=1 Tax=Thermococcus sp. MV5 TaxID=1638272 RepID=UPI00143AFB21|nr:M48 family peptidase [Thermococcus sp. MV5]
MGLNYKIITRNVKYPRIEIDPLGEIKVIVPPNMDPTEVIKQKEKWIKSKLKEINDLRAQFANFSTKFLLNGEFYSMIKGEEFYVNPNFKAISLKEEDLKQLKIWLKTKLKLELDFKARLFASLLGIKYRKIYIRFQRTKWASCSAKGNLSFNLALMALPEYLRDYIIIHELVHLKVSKHNKKFWETVSIYHPDYKKAEAELRKYWLLLEWNEVWKKLREIK